VNNSLPPVKIVTNGFCRTDLGTQGGMEYRLLEKPLVDRDA